jgi:hypothetical protein
VDLATLKSRVWRRLDENADAPLRYTAELVIGAANDGIQLFYARTGLDYATTTITQRSGVLWYDLPSDCIRVQSVRRVDDEEPLLPIDWRALDEASSIPHRERYYPSRYRWTRETADRASHYLVFGLNQVGIWPMISSAAAAALSDAVIDEAFAGGVSFVTLGADPSGGMGVYVNGLRMKRVVAAAQPWEYSVGGSVVVFAETWAAGDSIQVSYQESEDDYVMEYEPVGTKDGSNTAFTIPSGVDVAGVWTNGTRLKATTDYTISGTTLTMVAAPESGDTLYLDYSTDSDVVTLSQSLTGTKNGTNREFSIAETPASTSDLAIYWNGVRLTRSSGSPGLREYTLSGANILLGAAPISTDTLYADFVRTSTADTEAYTVTYTRDVGFEYLDADDDELPLPADYEHALVEYVVGRMLLPGARGERIKAGMTSMGKFDATLTVANRRNSNLARINRSNPGVLR